MACKLCGQNVRGGFEVYARGDATIVIDSTPDRNFNVCDCCNEEVHFRCSGYPESGYCDECIQRYNLYDSLGR